MKYYFLIISLLSIANAQDSDELCAINWTNSKKYTGTIQRERLFFSPVTIPTIPGDSTMDEDDYFETENTFFPISESTSSSAINHFPLFNQCPTSSFSDYNLNNQFTPSYLPPSFYNAPLQTLNAPSYFEQTNHPYSSVSNSSDLHTNQTSTGKRKADSFFNEQENNETPSFMKKKREN